MAIDLLEERVAELRCTPAEREAIAFFAAFTNSRDKLTRQHAAALLPLLNRQGEYADV
jgi:hypothetical protein